MVLFLIDENMPRSSANRLRREGIDARDVRDVGLYATPDAEIFDYARSIGAIIITRDVGFASTLEYPLGTHPGIIVLRVPTQVTTDQLNSILLEAIVGITDRDLTGSLMIVEPGRTRIRRATG